MGVLKNFRDKTVLITGAAGGIGQKLARSFLDEGASLILVDQNEEGLLKLEKDLDGGSRVRVYVMDLTDPAELGRLVEELDGMPLHILINNAGLAPGGSFEEMELDQIRKVLRVNLEAAVSITHKLLPILKANAPSHVVNVASAAGLFAPGGMVAYAASKFGMVGFSEALRAELRSARVGVSAVCPAFVDTDIVLNSFDQGDDLSPEEKQRMYRLDEMVKSGAMAPDKVVRAVIKVIKRDQAQVVLGAPYRLAIVLRFFFPGLMGRLNRRNFEKLKSKGLV